MEDIVNKKFGRLIVIEPSGIYRRETVWKCLCECGKEKHVRISKLKNGYTRSCGCLKRPPKLVGKNHPQWGGWNEISGSLIYRIKASAKLRNITFEIDAKYLYELYMTQKGKCSLTGLPLYLAKNSKELTSGLNTASVDRIDSKKGYMEGNVQWTHVKINYMKQQLGQTEFIELCKLVAQAN